MGNKRGVKNVIFGLLNQLIAIAFGLFLPRLFIMTYGSETNGLLSSVNQIYSYVALLEAGIGTASLQALYRTISSENISQTNAVLSATHLLYKRTAFLYLAAVCILSASFPFLVKTEVPKVTVFFVVFFTGIGGVVNYFFQGKYQILLRAEGKNYLLSNISTCVYIASNIIRILFIYLKYSIVAIQFAHFCLTVAQNLYISLYIRKHYQWIDLAVQPDLKALSTKNSVIVHRLSNMVFSNTDAIILTLLCNLRIVSVYSMYNSFFLMAKSVLFSFLDGVQFLLGQTFHSDFKKFSLMEDRFETLYMTATFVLYTSLYLFMIPFLGIYTRGITDYQYVDPKLSLLFTLVFLLQGARGPMQLVIEYAQHFKQTKKHAVLEAVINLSITIPAVIEFGIYGALWGTVAALLYRVTVIVIYVNKNILRRNPRIVFCRWGWLFAFFVIAFIANRYIAVDVTSYASLILYGTFVLVSIIALYTAGLFIFERKTFLWCIHIIKEKGKGLIFASPTGS